MIDSVVIGTVMTDEMGEDVHIVLGGGCLALLW